MPTTSQNSAAGQPGFWQAIAKRAPYLLILLVVFAGWWTVHRIKDAGAPEASDTGAAEAKQDALPADLKLPSGKVAAGGFQAVPATVQSLEHVHMIPGRIRYDETKHIEIEAPLDGILTELPVTPGQEVAPGQLLAVLQSPDIGRARGDILRCRQELAVAEQQLQREQTLAENLQQMLRMLEQNAATETIEKAFRELDLGAYRQDILSAHAKRELARDLLRNREPLADSGAISGRAVRQGKATYQMAEAELFTARDQATFHAKQAQLKAAAAAAEAERQLKLAWQQMETLLGHEVARDTIRFDDEATLSRLEIRAPFAGTIESRGYAREERVSQGDSLMVLANTDSLYVAASIRESDWTAVSLAAGTPISVIVPALDERTFEARVRYFGREVQVATNAIPLVAEIDNREGLLRPGMFVRVTIPIGPSREALAVQAESVVQHENQSFVFVEQRDGRFRRVDVATGQASDDWIEVKSGLQPGQLVVTDGAFLLKSEWLLQGESE